MKKIICALRFWRLYLKNEFFPLRRWYRGKQLKRGEISKAHFVRLVRQFRPEGGE